uniref:Phosphoglycerate mutase-like protein 1 n=1 Tax=Ananas comosus var. bracteatus TaxID=296719 RepID=A0A6V7QK53_ANACO|nr:unnamed protein product [Ananas comosus var. bracteatus]
MTLLPSSYYYSPLLPTTPPILRSPLHTPHRRSRSRSPLPFLLRCSSAASSEMAGSTGSTLYPSHRCKTLHLVRHAQGIHNVKGEKDYKAYLSPELFDAHLTPLGWEQVSNLRKHVHKCGLAKKIDLVITSPLLRTMQTAVGVFGGESYTDGINVPPLMVENAGNSNHLAISSLNCPPFLAVEQCREHLGVHPCDKRRSISDYRPLFPAIDFSLIESDEDVLWKADVREKNEEVASRGMKFINWLWTRKEKEIAIVTHSGFLFHTLSNFGKDCHPTIKEEICKHFANCELRTMVLVDRSMLGLDSSNYNYPGKIPQGLDLPSDVAQEKQPEKKMPGSTGSTLYPSHHCKTLHLVKLYTWSVMIDCLYVRHAQGIHNVKGEKDHKAYSSPELFDAHLTPLGWEQVSNLRKHVHKCGLAKKIDLVVTSPLLRTMQTAVGVFGGESYTDGINVPSLMVENAGNSNHLAISSLNCPPFVAVEECRERLGVNLCDKRRSISDYRPLFPAIDFSLIESDEDVLWEADDCHPTIEAEICKSFANCELRSMVLVDRSMLGLDSSNYIYPGKIPQGLDLPSDVAQEKQPEKSHAN